MSEKVGPLVGVAVLVERGGLWLLGQRRSEHGFGDWCFPGGHLEWGEDFAACAQRETWEETGLILSHIKTLGAVNSLFPNQRHYVTVFVSGHAEGAPQILEPDKIAAWDWFHPDRLPEPLFAPILAARQEGVI